MEILIRPRFESEVGLKDTEHSSVDRLTELMGLLYEGKRDLVESDLFGLKETLRELFVERGSGFFYEVTRTESTDWGKNYAQQRKKLEAVLGSERVTALEEWGAELLERRGRGKKVDKSSRLKGVVVGQVVLDFYRFVASELWPKAAKMDAPELVEKLNSRMRNWRGEGGKVKNPTPCSGEMVALILNYLRTGEKADWRRE